MKKWKKWLVLLLLLVGVLLGGGVWWFRDVLQRFPLDEFKDKEE